MHAVKVVYEVTDWELVLCQEYRSGKARLLAMFFDG